MSKEIHKKGLAGRSCLSKCILTFLTIPWIWIKFDTQWEKEDDKGNCDNCSSANTQAHSASYRTDGEERGANIFQKSRSHLKILGARRVACNSFHTEQHISGATVHNLVARAT